MRWIIGDVHGMLRSLEAMLNAIARRDGTAELYFCGDYCDRGPDSAGTVDLLLTLPSARFVRGNHDDVMDLCCSGKSFGTGPGLGGDIDDITLVEVYDLFMGEGLAETLISYGIHRTHFGPPREGESRAGWIRRQFQAVPEAHKRFYRELPAVAEADSFFICHATWPPDQVDEPGRMNGIVAGDPYLRHDVLWSRYTPNQLQSHKAWRRIGYFGHTPTDNYLTHPSLIDAAGSIVRGDKAVLLDTAAFAPGGRLSAVCHDDGSVIQIGDDGRVILDG